MPRIARVRPPIGGRVYPQRNLVDFFYPEESSAEEKRHQRRRDDLEKARQLMTENIENPFRLSDLARLMHLHPRQVQRIFHSAGSEGFALEMRQLRLQKSRQMLSTLSVSEVSERLQYQHPSHFIRAFKKAYGETPKSWKNGLEKSIKKEPAVAR